MLVARGRVEAAQRGPLIIILPIRMATLLISNVLISLRFRSKEADATRVLFRIEAVLLLSEQVTHGVSLARVHG